MAKCSNCDYPYKPLGRRCPSCGKEESGCGYIIGLAIIPGLFLWGAILNILGLGPDSGPNPNNQEIINTEKREQRKQIEQRKSSERTAVQLNEKSEERELNVAYLELMNRLSAEGKIRLKTQQIRWIKDRESRCLPGSKQWRELGDQRERELREEIDRIGKGNAQ